MNENTIVELIAGADWDTIGEAVSQYCETDTDGLEDWLSHAFFPTVVTIGELAAEWDALAKDQEEA